MKRLAAFAVFLILTGCTVSGPMRDPKRVIQTSDHKTVTYGADDTQQAIIQAAVIRATPELRGSCKFLCVADDQHMVTKDLGGKPAAGHTHGGTKSLCLNENYIFPHFGRICTWHEHAHLLTYTVGSAELAAWKKIAGNVYADDYSKRDRDADQYPKNGLLSSYAAANLYEDIAVCTEQIYAWLDFYRDSAPYMSQFGLKDTEYKDPRIAKKIAWLRKNRFISEEDYQEILKTPLLQSP